MSVTDFVLGLFEAAGKGLEAMASHDSAKARNAMAEAGGVELRFPAELADSEDTNQYIMPAKVVTDNAKEAADAAKAVDDVYAALRTAVGARPKPPAEGSCCGEGCTNCVLDTYETRLDRWRARRSAWLATAVKEGRLRVPKPAAAAAAAGAPKQPQP